MPTRISPTAAAVAQRRIVRAAAAGVSRITSGATTSWRTARMTVEAFRMLTVIDEHSRECLAIDVRARSRATTSLGGAGPSVARHAAA